MMSVSIVQLCLGIFLFDRYACIRTASLQDEPAKTCMRIAKVQLKSSSHLYNWGELFWLLSLCGERCLWEKLCNNVWAVWVVFEGNKMGFALPSLLTIEKWLIIKSVIAGKKIFKIYRFQFKRIQAPLLRINRPCKSYLVEGLNWDNINHFKGYFINDWLGLVRGHVGSEFLILYTFCVEFHMILMVPVWDEIKFN